MQLPALLCEASAEDTARAVDTHWGVERAISLAKTTRLKKLEEEP